MAENRREPGTYIELDKAWDEPGWARVPNSIARLKTISRGAKGLVLELSSHAPGRRLTLEELVESSTDGRDATRARIAELERAGLLTRYQERDRFGRLGLAIYRLHVEPQGDPSSENPTTADPTTDDGGQTSRSTPISGNPTTGEPTTGSPKSGNPPTSKKTKNPEDKNPSSSAAADAATDQEPRDDVEQLCAVLRDGMLANECKVPPFGKRWRNAARLLLDRDHRPLDEALELLAWSQTDEFWRGNIQSMPTFRQKYDQLRLKWQKTNPVRYLRSEDAIRNWLREQWRQGHVKGIEERSGLRYPQPDLPDHVTTRDEALRFHAEAARQWITDHRDEITQLIKRREEPIAS